MMKLAPEERAFQIDPRDKAVTIYPRHRTRGHFTVRVGDYLIALPAGVLGVISAAEFELFFEPEPVEAMP